MITMIGAQHNPASRIQVSPHVYRFGGPPETVVTVEGTENLGMTLTQVIGLYRVDDLHISQLDPQTLADLIVLFNFLGATLRADMPTLIREASARLGAARTP